MSRNQQPIRLELNLERYRDQLQLQRQADTLYIRDPLRRKQLVLTPEEMVRQLLLLYLQQELRYKANRIAVEKQLRVNSLQRRCDILIFDAPFLPWMLVECKAPEVPLTNDTFRQIATYNLPLRVPYLLVCNGPEAYCCAMDYEEETYSYLPKIPAYGESPDFPLRQE